MKPECHQQDDAGWWVCIVMEGYWPEKLNITIIDKQFDDGTWYEETETSCRVCGQVEYSY